jgi:hypothetical protein
MEQYRAITFDVGSVADLVLVSRLYELHCPKRLAAFVTDNYVAGHPLSITKIFVTENKRPAPLLLVTQFSESFGRVWKYIFCTILQGL